MIRLLETGPILHAVIERAETRNAINFAVMEQLDQILDRLESDTSILAFTLRGSGGSFVSGGDLREFHQLTSGEEAMKMGRRMLSILKRIENLNCWTVCFTNGAVYGGGWEMMLSFDIRISLPDTVFGFTQGRFYLPPGWGGLNRLVRVAGSDQARWLLGSQRVIDAKRALDLGLVHEIVPSEEQFESLLQPLTMNDRAYISHVKKFSGRHGGVGGGSQAGIQNGQQENSHNASPQTQQEAELSSFARFWTHKEHTDRIEAFLASRRDSRT